MPDRKKIYLKVVVLLLALIMIAYICFSLGMSRQSPTAEPYFYKQWALQNNKATNVDIDIINNKYSQRKEEIDISVIDIWTHCESIKSNMSQSIVALIDTGVDFNHEDLKGRSWSKEVKGQNVKGWNFCSNNSDIMDYQEHISENDHGTACAGIIAANHNHLGIAGIAGNTKVRIMSLKVLENADIPKSGEISNVIRAIEYAEKMGAKVCNLSLNTAENNKSLEAAIRKSNMLFVVAAGNGTSRGVNIDKIKTYPASYDMDNIITVANLNFDGELHMSSNFGKNSVDIAAPGTTIYTTLAGNRYGYVTGTSMAAPHVTAIASILFSEYPDAKAIEIKNKILDAADSIDSLKGKVDKARMLNGTSTQQTLN